MYKTQFLFFSFQADLISESVVVFVCATTGQGDPPDNMMVLHFHHMHIHYSPFTLLWDP